MVVNRLIEQKVIELQDAFDKKVKESDDLNDQLLLAQKTITNLTNQLVQPDNKKTVMCYKQVQMDGAFDASCISLFAHNREIEKLLIALKYINFKDIPTKVQENRKTIFLGMEGCCRHYRAVKKQFKGYRVIAVDSA